MELQPINLSIDDLIKLQKRQLGHGTDGTVFKYKRNELIKIYHSNIYSLLSCINALNDDDIKIYQKGSLNEKRSEHLTAYFYSEKNNEHLRMRPKLAIKDIILRQKDVTMTDLPKNLVYIENRFAGYVLKRVYGRQIHTLSSLPTTKKKIIMLRVIKKVRELLDNNIYHVDLDNSPYSTKSHLFTPSGEFESVGHSHVLVDYKLEPWLIDLEGKSTIYTEKYDPKSEEDCLKSLCKLLIEFLLDINLDEISDSAFELNALYDALEVTRVNPKYIGDLADFNLNIDEMEDVVRTLR